MRVTIGCKVNQPMPDGRFYPAIAVSDEVVTKQTIIDKNTGQPVEIDVTRADFISQRTTREGVTYKALTNEVVNFGYRMVAMPRLSNVIGLDVDADGTLRTLEQNLEEHAETYSAWAAANFEARRATTALSDI